MTFEQWLALAGFILTLGAIIGGFAKYFNNQVDNIDQKLQDYEKSTLDKIDTIKSEYDKKIDTIKSEYVKSSELYVHMQRIESAVTAMNTRFDDFFKLLFQTHNK